MCLVIVIEKPHFLHKNIRWKTQLKDLILANNKWLKRKTATDASDTNNMSDCNCNDPRLADFLETYECTDVLVFLKGAYCRLNIKFSGKVVGIKPNNFLCMNEVAKCLSG